MKSAVEELMSFADLDDPYDFDFQEVRHLQLEAANERFETAQSAIRSLAQRAEDARIKRIESLDDLVPLLFSHATYKSYPDSLLGGQRWNTLGAWMDALSVLKGAAEVDVTNVQTIDEWIDRLRAAGHVIYASSGTTGKASFFQVSEHDRQVALHMFTRMYEWRMGAKADQSRTVIAFMPSRGAHRFGDASDIISEFGRPGRIFYMSEEPVLVDDINAMGKLRQKIASGRAAPSEIASAERLAKERESKSSADFERLVDVVAQHRDEPVLLIGFLPMFYRLAIAFRARGIGGGLHPDTFVITGGGRKAAALPEDVLSEIQSSLGLSPGHLMNNYGMAEMMAAMPLCVSGRYHVPPWLIPLVLDKPGEALAGPQMGTIEGRAAFLDLAIDGRWGGLVTGDRITLNLSPCPCGRSPVTISDDVVRFSDLPEGEDKLTCAGTVDAYVRGEIGVNA